jgi:hypothetical protein
MLAIFAAIAFAIAAFIAFAGVSGISALGVVAVGLFFLALHLATGGWNPITLRR